MLRYIKDNLASIDGIEIYPIISLLIFFTFFVLLIWWVLKMDDEQIDKIKNIPLNEK